MIHRKAAVWTLAAALILLVCSCSHRPALHPVVPRGGADLIDPDMVVGTLPNGFQYILKHNATPLDRVNIHLNIFAGSMHETDEQQGVAHFLEHMLFNGSEHFKPGELAQYFPTIGMDFGADANARTSFFHTVYDLSLPSGSQTQLDEAFVIVQDYAKGALLLESEIQREKGIILAEKRERDSAAYRTFKKTLGFELDGSLYVDRFPIGEETVIRQADRNLLKRFYDRWYRPENMALIVVGDADVDMVEKMVIKRFSALTPRAPFTPHPMKTTWTKRSGLNAFYHYEPESGSTDVTIETLNWKPFDHKTPEDLKLQTVKHLAAMMLQNRLQQMLVQQTADFSEATVFFDTFLQHVSMSAISATCIPDHWEKTLGQLENTLRQALVFGFEQRELDRVKADYLSVLDRQVSQAATQRTADVARRIVSTIQQKGLLLSPLQRKTLLGPYVETITRKDIQRVMETLWSGNDRLILVTGNADIGSPSPINKILDAYQDAAAGTVSPHQRFESQPFPYLDATPRHFDIHSRNDNVNGLGITTVTFENHVQLNLKSTEFKQKEILFKASFGPGKQAQPVAMPGLAWLAQTVVNSSGLGKLDKTQLDDVLAGRIIDIAFDIQEDGFVFSGAFAPDEAGSVFELICHYMNDPGFRQNALDLAKSRYRQRYHSMARTVDGVMHINGDRFLAGNDTRFGLPHPDLIDEYTLDDIQNWLTVYFDQSALDISLVGDFDIDQMITLASQYVGRLRPHTEIAPKTDSPALLYNRISFPKGESRLFQVDTRIDAGQVRIAFLTDDYWKIRLTRRLSVLARVFSERLRLEIREALGETYSPYVYNDPSMIFDGYGVMHVVVNVDPDKQKQDLVCQKVQKIIHSMRHDGISKNEVVMAVSPVLSRLKTLVKTNEYWLNSVMSNLMRYPERLSWAADMTQDYAAIHHDELTELVRQYFVMEDSARIVIEPKKEMEPDS